MNALFFATYLAVLTVKEHCVNWDCKITKVFNQRCDVYFDGKVGSMLGLTIPLKQYMWGPLEGFDGNDGVHSMTLFFKHGRLYKAYVTEYSAKDTYNRWTCEVRNKRACIDHLTEGEYGNH